MNEVHQSQRLKRVSVTHSERKNVFDFEKLRDFFIKVKYGKNPGVLQSLLPSLNRSIHGCIDNAKGNEILNRANYF